MDRKEIYLAGGCYWGTEKYVSGMKGVLETEVGFANGKTQRPTYEQVCKENTDHAETVKVIYDADKLPLSVMLKLFWKIIDPTSVNQQGEDIGRQYRTGIYYTCEDDKNVILQEIALLQENFEKKIAVEVCPLENFWPAEEYHQKYLNKNPNGYCHVSWDLIDWIESVDPIEAAREI